MNGTLAAYRGLLANRPLTKLLGGEFVSAIGDWLYIVALLVVIYRETGDPVILGLFGAVRMVPYVLLSIPAGILADRVDRRLILLVTDLARGACMLGMAWLVATDGPIWALVVLSILAACFSTFFYPAIGAYLPNLAEDERQLGPANSAWASLDNLGFVVGPVLGGLLVAAGGTTFAFLINAATFLVIAVVLWTLPPSRNVAPKVVDSSSDLGPVPGVGGPPSRFHVVPLIGIATLQFVSYAITGGVGVLTVIYAIDVLAAGEGATGYLNAAIGVGGVVGALVSGLLVLRRSLAWPVMTGAVVVAVGAALLGMSQHLVVAMLAIALVSAGHLVLDVIGATLLQRVTSDDVRGRAVGAMVTVDTLAEASGAFVFPVLVTAVGAGVVLGASGILMVIATAVGLVLVGAAATRAPSPFEATVARVARLALFAGVSSSALESILGKVKPMAVVAGQVVIREGDPADRFYLIESGAYVVRQTDPDGAERELRRLGPDEVFGELGLLTGAPRSATIEAVTDGTLLALDRTEFLALVSGSTPIRGRLLSLYEPSAISTR